jgi:hypothetical protein
MLAAMAAEPTGSPRELLFYEAALSLSYQATDTCSMTSEYRSS